jgi:hypothetical protein
MHFSAKFLKQTNKEKKIIEFDKVFKFKKNNEIILPLGSCFLDIFCAELVKKKYNICFNQKPTTTVNNNLRFFHGNFFNPLNLLNNLERVVLKKWSLKDKDYIYSKEFGHYINLYVKARFITQDLKSLKNKVKEIDKYFLNEIKKSTIILLSFDTNEAWTDRYSKKTWYSFYGNIFNEKPFNNRAELKVLNYETLKETIKKIINILSKVGKKKKFILMTSPNKLWSTFQNKDIELSQSYSTSTYNSVFNDLSSKNISYFPSFEIFNNLNERKKYRKDYRHINNKTVYNIMEPYFNKMYFKK